jgi:hypothetical protein
MAWNPKRHFSRDGYREHVQTVACETMRGHRTPIIGGKTFLPYWWIRNEIRVFWDAAISQQTVDLIIKAVDERIRETIGLPFRFNLFGAHPSAMEQVADATVNGQIDEQRLFATALSESWRDSKCGGQQHADIYITNKPFLNDTVSWGAADFKFGAMVFCLYGNRQNSQGFLRNVALHETNHLLGMYCHCDDYQNVEGLSYSPRCNMHYSCQHESLCPKCTDFIRNWWAQVAHEYEQSYGQLQQEMGLTAG